MKVNFWESNNCYVILGIAPKASLQEIRSAYLEASRRNHPDLEGGSTTVQTSVNLAYVVLNNAVDRVAHDLRWRIEAKSNDVASGETTSQTDSTSARGQPQAGRAAPRQERRTRTA